MSNCLYIAVCIYIFQCSAVFFLLAHLSVFKCVQTKTQWETITGKNHTGQGVAVLSIHFEECYHHVYFLKQLITTILPFILYE